MAPLKLKELNASSSKVRAHRLRKKKVAGKINPAETAWLQNYEAANATAAKFRAQNPAQKAASLRRTFDVSATVRKPDNQLPPREQLTLSHSTVPVDAITGAGELFTPTKSTLQPDGTEGKPEPVLTAAPTADDAAREASAEQLAALVALIVTAGAESAKRMAHAKQLPGAEMLMALGATSPTATAALVAHVHAAAKRVALKHSATLTIPYADEITVTAALAGSAVAVVYERKMLAEATTTPTNEPPKEPTEPVKKPTAAEGRFYK